MHVIIYYHLCFSDWEALFVVANIRRGITYELCGFHLS